MTGLVVGVDGSDHAHRALSWAMKEAAIRHVPLTVLAVQDVAADAWTGSPIILPGDQEIVAWIRNAVQETVAKTAAELGQPQPESVTVRAGRRRCPAHELIEASTRCRTGGCGLTPVRAGSLA